MADENNKDKDPNEEEPIQPNPNKKDEEEKMEGETSPPINLEEVDDDELDDADSPIHADTEEEAKRSEHHGEAHNKDPEQRQAKILTDEEYLHERLENQMNWYDRKSSLNQKKYKKFKKREFFIAASVPVLITLSQMGVFKAIETPVLGTTTMLGIDTVLSILATVLGVYLAILKNNMELEEFYKFWKEYRTMAESLQQERMLYLTRSEPYDEDDAYPLLVEKVESILNKETQKWRSRPEPQAKQGQQSGVTPAATSATPKI